MRYLFVLVPLLLLNVSIARAQEEAPPQLGAAETFLYALYAGDTTTEAAVSEPFVFFVNLPIRDQWEQREEPKVALDSLQAWTITREEAGDYDPFSTVDYVRATTSFSYGDRRGAAAYAIGLRNNDDGYRVYVVNRDVRWAPPGR